MTPIAFLQAVWGNQRGWAALPYLENGRWVERLVEYPFKATPDLPTKADCYFCPNLFSIEARKRAHVNPTRWLWADLDAVDPKKLPWASTLLWETSPGRYQALWRVKTKLTSEQAESLSKRMTYAVGADRSGWDLTQVLRIPGTRNHKPAYHKPMVRLLEEDGPLYDYSTLDAQLPPAPVIVEAIPAEVSSKSAATIRAEWEQRIPGKAKMYLDYTKLPTGAKRYEILWAIVCQLAEIGMPPGEIAVLTSASVWNKYKGRADQWDRLLGEATKAVAQIPAHAPSEQAKGPQFLTLDAMMRLEHDVNHWLIRDIWSAESHGLLAGQPKTFKSTISWEMAIAVASGHPFLDAFTVEQSGPVVIVQEENPAYYMQDRILKVLVARGLLPADPIRREGRTLEITMPPRLPMTFLNRQGFLLTDDKYRQLLEEHIDTIKPALVILDSLYNMVTGMDENEAQEIRPVLRWLRLVAAEYKTAIVLIHHMRKDSSGGGRAGQRVSGHHSLHGWTDSALYAVSGKRLGEVTLEREIRASGLLEPLALKVEVGDIGVPLYRCDLQ